MLISKSNGLLLKEHSEIISICANAILKNIVSDEELVQKFKDTIKHASFLHDIGKLTTNFQKFLTKKTKKPGLKFRHNEIGWAFLSKYLSTEFTDREIILNIVYWHHGISNEIKKHTDSEILDKLDTQSKENMIEYLTECVGEENVITQEEYVDPVVSPLFSG